jgi:putative nucleotidyltransferase with HDIG domain
MTSPALTDLLPVINSLPSLSAVVLDLLQSLGHEEVGNTLLAQKISQDQALSARTLKLANSSFYGSSFRSKTVHEAVAVLGSKTIRRLATASALIDGLQGGGRSGFDVTSLWRHSIATALCAAELAQATDGPSDIAYVAGLLHDVGRLALATHLPTEYQQAMAYRAEQDCSVLQAERQVLGTDHSAVGEALAQHWKLPEELQQAVACHHAVRAGNKGLLPIIVLAADAMAHALDLAQDPGEAVPPIPALVWSTLALNDEALQRVMRKVLQQFEAASSVLDS